MKMIIGGAAQGKKEYARLCCPETRFIEGSVCGLEEVFSCQGIFDFHELIRRWMMEGREENLAEQIIAENPDIVIVSDEIGYGLVPVDEFQRRYREYTGRTCTKLAGFSCQVDRVVCGIGTRIKGKE